MLRLMLGFIMTVLFGATAWSSSFQTCLAQASRQAHKLDRFEAIQSCFVTHRENLNSDRCYQAIEKLNLQQTSVELGEQLKGFCFFEVSNFKTVDSCLQKSQQFHTANDKDEAVFECYVQFQKNISAKQCLEISKKMIYPLKRQHLEVQCNNN